MVWRSGGLGARCRCSVVKARLGAHISGFDLCLAGRPSGCGSKKRLRVVRREIERQQALAAVAITGGSSKLWMRQQILEIGSSRGGTVASFVGSKALAVGALRVLRHLFRNIVAGFVEQYEADTTE